jgi:hypothetical protein
MANRAIKVVLFFVIVAVAFFGSGCKKQRILTSGGILTFSVDTLKFDTVFTSESSFTTGFLIYNPQNEEVVISSVRMLNGSASFFHLNVDGYSGNYTQNLKIAAHDSLYVFATVNINPNDSTNPFLITDSLVATMNGKQFYVPFTALGQNAHYIISDSFTTNTTWLTDLPYVVIHNCVIGQGVSLTIPPKCRVYMHQDAQFIIYPTASLNIGQGATTPADSVVFQGDRLDRAYFGYIGYPGEWCGLWFTPGSTGRISNAVFKNCGGANAYYNYPIIPAAMRVDSGAKVTMDHTVIKNSISIGLLGFEGNITARSCMVNTTGGEALAISMGGTDSLINCTFANFGTAEVAHSDAPTAAILDWYKVDVNTPPVFGNMNVLMQNCIVYGSLDSEIICDTSLTPAGITTKLQMDHCLLKMGSVREPFINFTSCVFTDPEFKDTVNGDFHLNSGSPALNAGNASGAPTTNLHYDSWSGAPNIGCY